MVVTDEGLSELATRLAGDITKGQWGSGTNLPDPTDTGLQTPIAATLLTLTSAVASGNRNFPGRIHGLVRGNFLASPMLVVAYTFLLLTSIY